MPYDPFSFVSGDVITADRINSLRAFELTDANLSASANISLNKIGGFPSISGNSGKFLTTNGSNLTWQQIGTSSISGPTAITELKNFEYTINDYDISATYSVSSNIGTSSISGNVITVAVANIPNPVEGPILLTLIKNSFRDTLNVGAYSFIPTTSGAAFGGGYLVKASLFNDKFYITSPVSAEQTVKWKTSNTSTPGTSSTTDGLTNNNAMNNSSHPAAQYARNLNLGGYTDWYLPAKDELNYIWTNRANLPAGQEYGPTDTFWSSTEYSATEAWTQYFTTTQEQYFEPKSDYPYIVRPIRSFDAIGKFWNGGYIIGILNNFVYIVSPKSTETSLRWKTTNTATTGTSSLSDGLTNTNNMNNSSHPAAQYTRSLTTNGYSDWFLPARNELALLIQNKHRLPLEQSVFYNAYWSSTQSATYTAEGEIIYADDGYQASDLKSTTGYLVRAVRKIAV